MALLWSRLIAFLAVMCFLTFKGSLYDYFNAALGGELKNGAQKAICQLVLAAHQVTIVGIAKFLLHETTVRCLLLLL